MRWRELRGQRQWVLAARGAAGSAAKAMPVNSAARMGSCRSWQGRGAWTMDFSRPGAAGASSRARPWQPPARARTRGARAWRLGRAPARAPASPPRGRGHAGRAPGGWGELPREALAAPARAGQARGSRGELPRGALPARRAGADWQGRAPGGWGELPRAGQAAGSAAKAMPVHSAARIGSCRSWHGRGAWTMDFSRRQNTAISGAGCAWRTR